MSKPNVPGKGLLKGKTGGIDHKWWLVGGVGAALGGWYYYRHVTQTSTADTAATTDATGLGTDPNASDYGSSGSYDGYGSAAGGTYGGDPQLTNSDINAQSLADTAAAEQDQAASLSGISQTLGDLQDAVSNPDQSWLEQATKKLLAHGYDPTLVKHALANYLGGVPLTQKQLHAIESVVGMIGAPPVAQKVTVRQPPKPAKKKATAKKKHHHHKS